MGLCRRSDAHCVWSLLQKVLIVSESGNSESTAQRLPFRIVYIGETHDFREFLVDPKVILAHGPDADHANAQATILHEVPSLTLFIALTYGRGHLLYILLSDGGVHGEFEESGQNPLGDAATISSEWPQRLLFV